MVLSMPGDASVRAVFDGWPQAVRARQLEMRALILRVASDTAGVGRIEEALRWGEPAYLTTQSRSGTTLRLGWSAQAPSEHRLLCHCQTRLVDTWRSLFGDELRFDGNRAVVLSLDEPLPEPPLAVCIEAALTYHQRKRTRPPELAPQ